MSKQDQARRTAVEITFDGADITKDIKPYLLSVSYTDNEEDAADDLQIKIQDRDVVWQQSWLEKAIQAAAAGKLKFSAVIKPEGWGDDAVLPTGDFELDSIEPTGPPAEIAIKGTALPFSAPVRQTKKSKAWESYNLSGIANEIAGNAGMTCMYEASNDPFYRRVEQVKASDIDFLSRLCHNAGISLKITDNMLVLFDQKDYEGKGPVFTIKRGSGKYIKYKLGTGAADTQYGSCRVSYTDPGSGKCIEGTYTASGEDAKSGQRLEIRARVADASEAKTLAEKNLRLHNKFTRTASFTLPGNTALVSGVTVMLEGWGGWDGKYIIKQARHTVDGSGYITQIAVRRVLEGY
jgi:phage protein D